MPIFILIATLFLNSNIFAHPGDLFYDKGFSYQKKKQYSKAISFYRSAAKLKHPQALSSLGRMYLLGLGTEVDHKLGIDTITLAANLNYLPAQLSLAQVCRDGLFEQAIDLHCARRWYQSAFLLSDDPDEKKAIQYILENIP